MKLRKMSQLIVDHVMLVYLHDLLSLREKDNHFYNSDVYHVLSEPPLATVILGLRKSIMSIIGLIALIVFLKRSYLSMSLIWQLVGLITFFLFYWVIIFLVVREIKEIRYQFQLKRAARYALDHFNYYEFVIFLDQYLSVKSSKVYFDETVLHT